jgi:hypothetical protein
VARDAFHFQKSNGNEQDTHPLPREQSERLPPLESSQSHSYKTGWKKPASQRHPRSLRDSAPAALDTKF